MSVQTTPFKASGTTLGYSLTASSPYTYTPVGKVTNFDFGGTDIAKIDTTDLSSTSKTSIPSIPDNGDVTFTINFVPGSTVSQQLMTWAQTPAVVPWQVQYPDDPTTPANGSTTTFFGFLSNFARKGFEVDGTPKADVTITISGGITDTPGT